MQDAAATRLTNPLNWNMPCDNDSQPVAQDRRRAQNALGTRNMEYMERKTILLGKKDP